MTKSTDTGLVVSKEKKEEMLRMSPVCLVGMVLPFSTLCKIRARAG